MRTRSGLATASSQAARLSTRSCAERGSGADPGSLRPSVRLRTWPAGVSPGRSAASNGASSWEKACGPPAR